MQSFIKNSHEVFIHIHQGCFAGTGAIVRSICHITALITNCNKSQIATAEIHGLLQFVTVQNTSQIDINSSRGSTPKYNNHVHIDIGQFQEGFLATSFMDLITDIQKNRYTIEKHQNGQKYNFSSSCQKWTLVISQVHRTNLQCYWNQYATSRPSSQIETNHKLRRQEILFYRNLWLSQFVTVRNTSSQISQ